MSKCDLTRRPNSFQVDFSVYNVLISKASDVTLYDSSNDALLITSSLFFPHSPDPGSCSTETSDSMSTAQLPGVTLAGSVWGWGHQNWSACSQFSWSVWTKWVKLGLCSTKHRDAIPHQWWFSQAQLSSLMWGNYLTQGCRCAGLQAAKTLSAYQAMCTNIPPHSSWAAQYFGTFTAIAPRGSSQYCIDHMMMMDLNRLRYRLYSCCYSKRNKIIVTSFKVQVGV